MAAASGLVTVTAHTFPPARGVCRSYPLGRSLPTPVTRNRTHRHNFYFLKTQFLKIDFGAVARIDLSHPASATLSLGDFPATIHSYMHLARASICSASLSLANEIANTKHSTRRTASASLGFLNSPTRPHLFLRRHRGPRVNDRPARQGKDRKGPSDDLLFPRYLTYIAIASHRKVIMGLRSTSR